MPHESEKITRKLRIDKLLKDAGWLIIHTSKVKDFSVLTNHAVEECETANGPVDYALVVNGKMLGMVDAKKMEELESIITEENLDKDETYKFINNAFRDGFVQNTGTAISEVLPPVSRFTATGDRTKKRDTVLEKLGAFFNKFWDISGGRFLSN